MAECLSYKRFVTVSRTTEPTGQKLRPCTAFPCILSASYQPIWNTFDPRVSTASSDRINLCIVADVDSHFLVSRSRVRSRGLFRPSLARYRVEESSVHAIAFAKFTTVARWLRTCHGRYDLSTSFKAARIRVRSTDFSRTDVINRFERDSRSTLFSRLAWECARLVGIEKKKVNYEIKEESFWWTRWLAQSHAAGTWVE